MWPEPRRAIRRPALLFIVAIAALPGAAAGQALETLPYVPEAACSDMMEALIARETSTTAELDFVSGICHASRLVDFKARSQGDTVSTENGQTRSLPRAGETGEDAPAVDRMIEAATQRSRDTWEELAQGDPQAAYDLLRRLIGDGSGN